MEKHSKLQGYRQVSNYRQFLKVSRNKAAFAAFVSDHIVNVAASMLSGNQRIILAGGLEGQITQLVPSTEATTTPSLFSCQEEGDTRMLFHAIDLSSTHDRLVIRSDDNDVLVMLLYYCRKDILSDLVYMLAVHKTQMVNRQRYIPVHSNMAEHGVKFSESFPATHALTGCGSTSSLHKIGKHLSYTKLL